MADIFFLKNSNFSVDFKIPRVPPGTSTSISYNIVLMFKGYLSIYFSIYLSTYLNIYLSICLDTGLKGVFLCPTLMNKIYLEGEKSASIDVKINNYFFHLFFLFLDIFLLFWLFVLIDLLIDLID